VVQLLEALVVALLRCHADLRRVHLERLRASRGVDRARARDAAAALAANAAAVQAASAVQLAQQQGGMRVVGALQGQVREAHGRLEPQALVAAAVERRDRLLVKGAQQLGGRVGLLLGGRGGSVGCGGRRAASAAVASGHRLLLLLLRLLRLRQLRLRLRLLLRRRRRHRVQQGVELFLRRVARHSAGAAPSVGVLEHAAVGGEHLVALPQMLAQLDDLLERLEAPVVCLLVCRFVGGCWEGGVFVWGDGGRVASAERRRRRAAGVGRRRRRRGRLHLVSINE
jgi:hypothetical protein